MVLTIMGVLLVTVSNDGGETTGQYVTGGEEFRMGALEKRITSWRAENGDISSAVRMAAYYALGPAEQLEGISQAEASRHATHWDEVAAENGDTQTQRTLVAKHLEQFSSDPVRHREWMERAAAKRWIGAQDALDKMKAWENK